MADIAAPLRREPGGSAFDCENKVRNGGPKKLGDSWAENAIRNMGRSGFPYARQAKQSVQ